MKRSKLFKTLLIPMIGIATNGMVAAMVTSCGCDGATKVHTLDIDSLKPYIQTYNGESGSSDIIELKYDGIKVSDIKNATFTYCGDSAIANEIYFDSSDSEIHWTEKVGLGTYMIQWMVTYKNISSLTPEISFEVINRDSVRWIPGVLQDNPFWFSEHFFDNPSTIYNPSLMSATTASLESACTYEDGVLAEDGDKYIKNLIVDRLQLENYEQFGYTVPTTADSIAAAAGCKTFPAYYFNDDYPNQTTLIYLSPRSYQYHNEWSDNMYIGHGNETRTATGIDGKSYTYNVLSKNHAGFDLSAQIVINFLRLYIEKYSITGRIKLWISGWSRGAAVSNIAAALLDKSIHENNLQKFLGKGNYTLQKEDIYAYTFGTPNGANMYQSPEPRSDIYNNIFNMIDPNDLVIYMAPKQWGFGHYGIDYYLGTRLFDTNYFVNIEKRKKHCKDTHIYDLVIDFKQYYMDGDVNSTEFKNYSPQSAWTSVMDALNESISNRDDYVNGGLQGRLWEIITKIVGPDASWTDFLPLIQDILVLNNARLISWAASIGRGEKDVVRAVHSLDNYQASTKAADILYNPDTPTDLLDIFTEYCYYGIYSRTFNYVSLFDRNDNSKVVFKDLDPDTDPEQPNIYDQVAYAGMVCACIYNYPTYPYYIEANFPSGNYLLQYQAYGQIRTEGFMAFLKYSSSDLSPEILNKWSHSLTPYVKSDLFSQNLDCE